MALLFAGLLDKLLGLVPKAAAPAPYLESTMGLLDQAHSFAQGASNGVASSLTGPVDGLAWLLRKAGVPVPQAPLGGSDWMRNVGLMQEPKERMAGLLGEGIGSALPTVIAGKAPQIANGLLQMEANAMAPRTLNPQTGAILWHGSPHKFDKFDSSKIGTGEGAQAYGHGLYLAESPDVAQTYKASNSKSARFEYNGRPIPETDELQKSVAYYLTEFKGDKDAIRAQFKPTFFTENSSGKKFGKLLDRMDYGKLNSGSLYKVDLPDDQIARMLDWDKPLSQQPPEVQAVLMKHPDVLEQIQKSEAQRLLLNERNPLRLEKIPSASIPYDASRMAGKDALTAIRQRSGLGVTGGVEQQLRAAGIPGIRYLDGGSRGAGAGTSNFVVFPGNEGLLKILERNGQGLLGN